MKNFFNSSLFSGKKSVKKTRTRAEPEKPRKPKVSLFKKTQEETEQMALYKQEYLSYKATIKRRNQIKKSVVKGNARRKKEAHRQSIVDKRLLKEQRKSNKDTLYIMRKNTFFKTLRFFLWAAIIFIFIKGVIVSIRPDPMNEVQETIQTFKSDFTGYKDNDNEVLAFAENFATNFFTYKERSESEYVERLSKYASDKITKYPYFLGKTTAIVTYAKAYRKEEYSTNQIDVFVLLHIQYTFQESSEGGVKTEKTTTEVTTVKVPVYWKGGRYIIEDFPAIVNDSLKLSEYPISNFSGTEATPEINESIHKSLSNFFKAYTQEEQAVISYYLSPNAEASKFLGLNNRMQFESLESLRVYDLGNNNYLALVTVLLKDKNGLILPQNYNVILVYKDNQYYVEAMNVRNVNLDLS